MKLNKTLESALLGLPFGALGVIIGGILGTLLGNALEYESEKANNYIIKEVNAEYGQKRKLKREEKGLRPEYESIFKETVKEFKEVLEELSKI
ncbi:MAG: hypothetical protein NZ872_05290 [Archaeoglobaceae archaeon]|nr:hypothetical protein [Archaeoglobaceae archaeon]MDW8128612.1 hypothetical protein [Archaeoglobaceae archaeon]